MAKKRRLKKSFKITIGMIITIGLVLTAGYFYYNNALKPAPKIKWGKITEFDANSDYGVIKDPNKDESITTGANFKYYVFDIGMGYSLFIDCGDKEVLIDAGNVKTGKKVVKKIKPLVNGELEYVISTNTKDNRIGGLPEVLKNFRVQNVIYSKEDGSKGSNALKAAAKTTKYKKGKGNLITLGENANLSIIAYNKDASTPEEKSLSTVFTYGETKISETGDLPEKYANNLSDELADSTVMIAANNGEYTSNKLLEIISPAYYVIPTSKKLSKEMKEWTEENARYVYTTKKDKDIIFSTNGSETKSNHEEQ